jgi:uncharacterized protein YkwD
VDRLFPGNCLTLVFVLLSILAFGQEQPADKVSRELLSAHNEARARAGVPPLTWSTFLEAVARQWAESLLSSGKFEHQQYSPYGENLFEVRGALFSGAKVVETWVNESRDYNAKTNTCRAGAVCGHYTQVIWRNTREVGCAVARGQNREVWVCEYSPPGNYVGQRPF